MNNLAMTYSALGRHEDALELFQRGLEFSRRVLPEDHPQIGEGRIRSDAILRESMSFEFVEGMCFG